MSKYKTIAETITGKFLILVLLVIPSTIVILALFGLAKSEFVGNVIFSVLVCSVLVNIAVLLTAKVGKGTLSIVRIYWILISLLILAIAASTISEALLFGMETLCFPASIIVNYIVYYIHTSSFYPTGSQFVNLFLTWLVFFIPGYIQWFILIGVPPV